MKRFYLRWGVLLLIGLAITGVGAQRYYRDVYSLTPEQILKERPSGEVRVLGRVEAGTLTTEAPSERAAFRLAGKEARIPVDYHGPDSDNLRELKTVVVIGHWDDAGRRFAAREIDNAPNYGFITAAYLTLVPMALFLFVMEHRVLLLYNQIKQSKQYESEVGEL